MEHKYKGYVLIKNGTSKMPWNVYRMKYSKFLGRDVPEWLGFGKTMKQCKADIDSGCYEMCNMIC